MSLVRNGRGYGRGWVHTAAAAYRLGKAAYGSYKSGQKLASSVGKVYAGVKRKMNDSGWTSGKKQRGVYRKSKINVRGSGKSLSKALGGGYYRGRINKGRRLKYKLNFNKRGSVSKMESGGTVTGAQCVYVGHSTNGDQVWRSVGRALVKELYKQAGYDIISWEDPIPFAAAEEHFLTMDFFINPDDPIVTVGGVPSYGVGTTFDDVSNGIVVELSNANRGYAANSGLELQRIILFNGDSTANNRTLLGSIQLSSFMLNIEISSKLKVQNSTLAHDGTDENDELSTDVRNNPVHGKVYHSKGWTNGFTMTFRERTSAPTFYGFTPEYDSPLISQDGSALAQKQLLKPPGGYTFKANATACRMNPGDIKYDKWFFSCKIGFNNFVKKMSDMLNRITAPSASPMVAADFGRVGMIGLEKLLDTRTSEAPLLIGYEIEQVYKCAGYNSRPSSLALVSV